jgi:hypothetical protein
MPFHDLESSDGVAPHDEVDPHGVLGAVGGIVGVEPDPGAVVEACPWRQIDRADLGACGKADAFEAVIVEQGEPAGSIGHYTETGAGDAGLIDDDERPGSDAVHDLSRSIAARPVNHRSPAESGPPRAAFG